MRESKHVAVLVETSQAYGRGILKGISRFHHENKSWSIFFKPRGLQAGVPTWLKSWKGHGIIARLDNEKMARSLLATGLPLIDLRGTLQPQGVPPFGADNRAVANEAYRYLCSRGLQHFAFVGEPTGQYLYDDQRREAFRELVERDGGQCNIFRHRRTRVAKEWEKQQQELVDWLLKCPKPIGVFCCHDDRGQQVLDACQRAELGVPDEVAVLGVDNDEYCCSLSIPTLSSVDINCERIGYEAAMLLDDLMNGEREFKEPILFEPAGIVERQSTDVVACDDPAIAAAMRIIRQNACNHITVTEVEQRIDLSHTAFNRRFKLVLGRSPKQEITRLQIEQAKLLIVSTDLSISKIAEKAGFSEAKYFITVFRKHTGITPRVYRTQHGRCNYTVSRTLPGRAIRLTTNSDIVPGIVTWQFTAGLRDAEDPWLRNLTTTNWIPRGELGERRQV